MRNELKDNKVSKVCSEACERISYFCCCIEMFLRPFRKKKAPIIYVSNSGKEYTNKSRSTNHRYKPYKDDEFLNEALPSVVGRSAKKYSKFLAL